MQRLILGKLYADYLEVKWRMVWFRHENVEGTRTVIKDKIIDTKTDLPILNWKLQIVRAI